SAWSSNAIYWYARSRRIPIRPGSKRGCWSSAKAKASTTVVCGRWRCRSLRNGGWPTTPNRSGNGLHKEPDQMTRALILSGLAMTRPPRLPAVRLPRIGNKQALTELRFPEIRNYGLRGGRHQKVRKCLSPGHVDTRRVARIQREHDIGIAAPAEFQRLTAADRDHRHVIAAATLEHRDQGVEQSGVARRRCRGENDLARLRRQGCEQHRDDKLNHQRTCI